MPHNSDFPLITAIQPSLHICSVSLYTLLYSYNHTRCFQFHVNESQQTSGDALKVLGKFKVDP